MKQKSYREILDSVASDSLEGQADLWPRIAAQVERKSFMKTLRTRPLMAIVLALLILLALTGVAYAIGKSLGYIPGIGMVETSSLRVLAEQVSQTRDGVTVTVEKAILNADNALIVLKVEGLSHDKFVPLEPLNTCISTEELRFLSGGYVKSGSGTTKPLNGAMVFDTSVGGGFESSYTYTHIPSDAADATLFIPCIWGALSPGILPENWELPLHFVPAPPDAALTMMPVTEIAPSTNFQTATTVPNVESTPSSVVNTGSTKPITLTQVIEAGDSYILVGEDYPPAPSQSGDGQLVDWILTDGNGEKVDYQVPPADMDFGGRTMLADKKLWAVQVARGFAPPLHITHRYRYVFPVDSQDTYGFEFDAGANPQQDQVWNVNQEFQLAGHQVRLTTITADNTPVITGTPIGVAGYWFRFETDDPAVNSFTVSIDGYIPKKQQSTPNNFAEGDSLAGQLVEYLTYPELPTGKLKVIFSNLFLNGELRSWTMEWQP